MTKGSDKEARYCLICGKPFNFTSPTQKYCGQVCATVADVRQRKMKSQSNKGPDLDHIERLGSLAQARIEIEQAAAVIHHFADWLLVQLDAEPAVGEPRPFSADEFIHMQTVLDWLQENRVALRACGYAVRHPMDAAQDDAAR